MEKQEKAKVFTNVWKHWKNTFFQNRLALVVTILLYLSAVSVELFFRPMQWKIIFDSAPDPKIWMHFSFIIYALVLGWILNRSGDYFLTKSESNIIKGLRDYAMEKLLGKSSDFFTSNSSGKLVAKSKRFSHNSEAVIDEFVFVILRACLFVIGLATYIWIKLPYLGIFVSSWVLVFVVVTVLILKFRLKYDLSESTADSVTTGSISDIFLSVFTLRAFSIVGNVLVDFKNLTKDEHEKRLLSWRVSNFQWAIQSALVVFLEIFVMMSVLTRVSGGIETIGTIALVQSFIASLANYMYSLGRSLNRIRISMADAYELSLLLDEEEVENTSILQNEISRRFSVSCQDVDFSYPGGGKALHQFSFVFQEGRRYGLVGHTGSGKSTLVKLILRLYEKSQGSISISGQDISSIEKNRIRSWISYVPQDPHFPSWTIKRILKMGKLSATDEELQEAAEKASCNFIWEKLPKGFETIVGERGIKLSGGERQRLAIACAILKDAPVVIMDEPTSALDAETEKYIQDAITSCFMGKTMIVVAHRLSTVAVLDEIVLMDNGSVVESGDHDTLLEQSETYSRMWQLQTNPEIV